MEAARPVFRNRLLPYLLVLPQVAVTLVFFIWPTAQTLGGSFLKATPFGDRYSWTGLANFTDIFRSPEYVRALGTTVVFTLCVVLGGLTISLFAALLASQRIRHLPAYRALLLWPFGIAPPVAGVIWMFLCHPSYGALPYYMGKLGLPSFDWLLNGPQALVLVISVAIWTQLGYNIAFFVAGLSLVPPSVLESASLDGASPWQRLVFVTLPLLAPITIFLLVMNLTYALFDTFGIINAVTAGGPGGATETLVYKAYRDGFVGMNLGSSAAQSVILMVAAAVFTSVQMSWHDRRQV